MNYIIKSGPTGNYVATANADPGEDTVSSMWVTTQKESLKFHCKQDANLWIKRFYACDGAPGLKVYRLVPR